MNGNALAASRGTLLWNRFKTFLSKPYNVILDNDFDGKIKNSVSVVNAVNSVNGRSGQDLRVRVGVFSYGDYNSTDLTKLAKSKKLVTSW